MEQTQKAFPGDLKARIREIQADPSNQRIPRVENAGKIVKGKLVMHNGIRVVPMHRCYMSCLKNNGGCHEPQEELVFQEVLPHIREGGCIIELGAYWAFYSMWFAKQVSNAKCYLVEPDRKNLETGRTNFANNGIEGEFILSTVGKGFFGVDRFLEERGIEFVDVLHSDIQGFEYEMLCESEQALSRGQIGYVFVGTHGQDLHYRCKQLLEDHGYITIANADFEHGTYCQDGVLVARLESMPGLDPMEIPRREPHQPYRLGDNTDDLNSILARGDPNRRRKPFRPIVRWLEGHVKSIFRRSA